MDESRVPAAKTESPSRWVKRQWGLIVAIVVPVVTLATIVVPLVAEASVRLTSVDTLAIATTGDPTAAPAAPIAQSSVAGLRAQELIGESIPEQFPNGYWRVQATAPWETFPTESSPDVYFCTADQIAWLEKWGRRDATDIWNGYLSLTNNAADGSSMSIRDIHSVGTFTEPPALEVNVECTLGIGGMSEIIPLRQELGTDSPAVFDANYGDQPKGSPASLNIAPGEFLQVVVSFEQDASRTSDFVGSLVGDVVVGEDTTEVVLFEGFTRKGVAGISTTRLTIAGHTIYCGLDGRTECTISEFVSQITSDPAYGG